MNFSHAELQNILNFIPQSQGDEVECLVADEGLNTITCQTVGDIERSKRTNCSVMTTEIRKNQLHRESFCTDTPDRLMALLQKKKSPSKSAHTMERAGFHFNSFKTLGVQTLPTTPLSPIKTIDDFTNEAQLFLKKTQAEWPFLQANVTVETRKEKRGIINTLGLFGVYERFSFYSRVELENIKTGQTARIFGNAETSWDDLSKKVEEKVSQWHSPLPMVNIKGGASPVILSPGAVALLGMRISSFCKRSVNVEPSLFGALPENFELHDEPLALQSSRQAPFDDEGTPTNSKCLIQKGEKVHSLSDLQTAHEFGEKSSGNGFRRNSFMNHVSECLPSPQPSQLRLSPGEKTFADIINTEEELLWIDHIVMPFSQIIETGATHDTWTVWGKYFRKGQATGNFVETRTSQNPIVSSKPRGSYGSLLDRRSVILKDGMLLESGWYPHIFVPMVRW